MYLLNMRADNSRDAPIVKKATLLFSAGAVGTGLKSYNYSALCRKELEKVTISSFLDSSVTFSTAFATNTTIFSLLLACLTFLVTVTTRSIPKAERLEAKKYLLSMSSLKNTDFAGVARKKREEMMALKVMQRAACQRFFDFFKLQRRADFLLLLIASSSPRPTHNTHNHTSHKNAGNAQEKRGIQKAQDFKQQSLRKI